MSVPPTEPRYSSSRRSTLPSRPASALTALALLSAVLLIAMLVWWLF